MAQSEEQILAQGEYLSEARAYANAYIKEFERQIDAGVKDGNGFERSNRINKIKELLDEIKDKTPEELAALPAGDRNKLLEAIRDIDKNNVSGKKLNWDENSGRFGDARADFESASRDYLDSLGQSHGKNPVKKAFGEGHQAFYEQAGSMAVAAGGWVAKKNDQFWEDPGGNLQGAANATGGFFKYVAQNPVRSVSLLKRGVAEGLGSGVGMVFDLGRWAGRHTLNSYTYMTDKEPWLSKPEEPISAFFSRKIGEGYTLMGVAPPQNGYERVIYSTGKATGEIGGVVVASVFTAGTAGFVYGVGRGGFMAIRTGQAFNSARAAATVAVTAGIATAPENVTSSLTLSSVRQGFTRIVQSGVDQSASWGGTAKRMLQPFTVRSHEAKFMPGRMQEAAELASTRLSGAAAHEAKLAVAGDNAVRASAALSRANFTGDVFGQIAANLGQINARWGQIWHGMRYNRLTRIAENSTRTSERFNLGARAHQALQYGRVAKPESPFFVSLTRGNLDPLRSLYHGLRATGSGGRVAGWAAGLETAGWVPAFTMGYAELEKKAQTAKEMRRSGGAEAEEQVGSAYDRMEEENRGERPEGSDDHSSLEAPEVNRAFAGSTGTRGSGLSNEAANRFSGGFTPSAFTPRISAAAGDGIKPDPSSAPISKT